MPNWCSNEVKIYFDSENESQLRDALDSDKELFQQFVPRPPEFDEGEKWYWWNTENWGTKWDTKPYDIEWEDDFVFFRLETAWGPPIGFYEKIEQMGYFVDAYYREEGMAFAGIYDNGEDDYYEYGGMSADEIEASLPSDLDEMFSISQYQRDCEMDEQDDDWDPVAELEKLQIEKPNRSQVDTPEGREWLRGLLHDTEVTVTFTKKDGTERAMVCTLVNDKIPSEKAPKNTGKSNSDEAIAVFDVEKQDWRSFRWDSVKRIEFSIG